MIHRRHHHKVWTVFQLKVIHFEKDRLDGDEIIGENDEYTHRHRNGYDIYMYT